MNPFFDFVQKNHILALIENAQSKKAHSLHLINFEIQQFPPQILNCHDLERLYLQCNKLTSLPILDQLSNLHTLALDYNCLQEFPSDFKLLKNLKILNVSHNPLRKIPSDVCDIEKLEVFWCNYCCLENLPKELGSLQNLETLGARNNRIHEIPTELCRLQKLRWLTLENNDISSVPDDFIQLQSLIHLNLSANNFTKIPKTVALLKNLKYFILKENFIADLSCDTLEQLKHVTKIDLVNNPLQSSCEIQVCRNFANLATNSCNWEAPIDVENDSETSSEDWEESLDSSELDLTSSDSENDENNEALAQVLPSISRFLSPT